jgi:tRNA(Ile2) C34 agmatinyltransferase TiaS
MKKTIQWKIRGETEKEVEVAKSKIERTNSPSPVSYKVGEAIDYRLNKKNTRYTIPKDKKKLFTDRIVEKSKMLPGVGKYDAHLSMDKTSRPMKKY